VETVFANISYNKRLTRFNHRGREKVNTQWNLYCMVHSIEKLAKSGCGQKDARQARVATASITPQICATLGA